MKSGKVKFYNKTKGYGFIIDSQDGSEIFVHATGLSDEIQEDDNVVFEVKDGKKGLNAINVRRK
jgi:CspA family cold shock protein